jgi:pimeloyl-ACP methyl ester carboxylesterase
MSEQRGRGSKLTFALGVMNGLVGDYLARTQNELAFDMCLMSSGAPLPLTKAALGKAHPDATSRVCVLLHGLMNTEEAFFAGAGPDYGTRLQSDFGVTPYYVRYNSGLPIPENGAAFARLLTTLVAEHPVPVTELVLLGYSMGGLVLRSACHIAAQDGLAWLSLVKQAIYVGTPHRGAPMERAGRVVSKVLAMIPDPYTHLIAQIADLRSDGIKDLGDADVREEDRARRTSTFSVSDARHPVPLLPQIEHLLVCGSVSAEPQLALWFGDVMVPVPSASFDKMNAREHLSLPQENVKYLPGLSHVALPCNDRVWEIIREFFARKRPTPEKEVL